MKFTILIPKYELTHREELLIFRDQKRQRRLQNFFNQFLLFFYLVHKITEP